MMHEDFRLIPNSSFSILHSILRVCGRWTCTEKPLALLASAIPERAGERPHPNPLPEGEGIGHTYS